MAIEKKFLGSAGTQELTKLIKQEIAQKIADLVNSAPTTMDTLGEIADAIEASEDVLEALDLAISGKVPTTRQVNGKALSTDVTLTAGDVGADAEGAANSALEDAKEYTETYVQQYVTESILGGEW